MKNLIERDDYNMEITQVKHTDSTRGGVSITFSTTDQIAYGDIVSIEYDSKTRYFKVSYVETINQFVVNCEATNYGYYNLLRNIKDIRDLLGLKITIVTDEDEIKKLKNQSHYC